MTKTKIWIEAFRLRTLPLAMSATILGSFLAFDSGTYKWSVFILGLLTTLFLQILSNLANDYGDSVKGTDNKNRIGPLRAMQSGMISRKHMISMIIIFVFLSLVSGSLLIYFGLGKNTSLLYLLFFFLGLTAIFAAIKYTIGKRPYGYAGLGDVMVFIFFGILGVSGTYFLHTQSFSWSILLPASAIGLFSVGVLNLNNLRDHVNDKENGKITLVVRMGFSWAKVYHASLLVLGFILSLIYTLSHCNSAYQFLRVLPVPLLVYDMRKVLRNTVPRELNSELRNLALATLLFALFFGIGLIL
ncbi:MAG: 1,4-dihydroxy-2-naphthoate polyprenyltransferase [Bacteroidales bacterium]|jgi:1,4-dihydroxy-2-naphthoate octaprenyltransferase|nr:1,4-dihydroxy-2-naphthoate polyprenyltransferase [Bacteroidales bacterium]